MSDHFGRQLSPFPALAAAAAATSTLRLGTLVACNDFRHPLMLAKEAATLDVLSDGRFELGIGAGWSADDYDKTGIRQDSPGIRVERLQEAVTLIKNAWSGEPFSFSGIHYTVTDYTGAPRPLQQPTPPLLIGSGAPKLLAVAAREADIIGFAPRPRGDGSSPSWYDISPDSLDRKLQWVREAARQRTAPLELSCLVSAVEITRDTGAAVERLARRFGIAADAVLNSPHIWVGSVDAICAQLLLRREQFGISYQTIVGDYETLAAAAPVVERLAGA